MNFQLQVYAVGYSKIRKYVDISMNNNPHTITLVRLGNLTSRETPAGEVS